MKCIFCFDGMKSITVVKHIELTIGSYGLLYVHEENRKVVTKPTAQ